MRPINPKKNFFKLTKVELASLGSFFLSYFFDKISRQASLINKNARIKYLPC